MTGSDMDSTLLIHLLQNLQSRDRSLDEHIARMVGWSVRNDPDVDGDRYVWSHPNVPFECEGPPSFTGSLDAAFTLVLNNPHDILNEAKRALAKHFSLHMCFWPKDLNYVEWLARFVTIEALRAREKKETDDDHG